MRDVPTTFNRFAELGEPLTTASIPDNSSAVSLNTELQNFSSLDSGGSIRGKSSRALCIAVRRCACCNVELDEVAFALSAAFCRGIELAVEVDSRREDRAVIMGGGIAEDPKATRGFGVAVA